MTLDKKSLNTFTKHIFPSLCQAATRVSYTTEHMSKRKRGQRQMWKQGYSIGTKSIQETEPKTGLETNYRHAYKESCQEMTNMPPYGQSPLRR